MPESLKNIEVQWILAARRLRSSVSISTGKADPAPDPGRQVRECLHCHFLTATGQQMV